MVLYDDSHMIETLTPAQAYFMACDKKYMWFCAGRGCFLKNTKVRMHDGSVKNIQDIVVDDVLMGDDLTPRHVMNTVKGREDAYRVQLEDGTYYDCNVSHDCVVVDELDHQYIKEVSVIDILKNGTSRYSQMRLVNGKPEKLKFELYYIGIEDYFGFNLDGNNRFLSEQGIFLKNSGKCHKHGTKIRMFDGSVKEIQDIVEGEYVMGWDSTPRKVIATCTGVDEMYEIKPNKGSLESHTVNSEHMLCLWKKHHGKDKGAYDVSLKEYMSGYKNLRYLFRVPVEYPERKNLSIPPYILGAWLGDGSKNSVEISAKESDKEVVAEWNNYFSQFEFLTYRKYIGEGANFHRFTIENFTPFSKDPLKNTHYFLNEFRKCISDDNQKFIPREYLISSRQQRMDLLAGLLDTDGNKQDRDPHQNYRIATIYPLMRDTIVELSESLGFIVNWYTKPAYKDMGKKGKLINHKESYHISIMGNNIDKIPCRLKRKVFENKRKVNTLDATYGFSVIPKGKGVYYGIQTEGDGRILLANGIVTRNTTVGSYWVYKNVIKYPKARGLLAANSYHQLHGATLPPVLTFFNKIGLDYRVNKRPPESWLKRSDFQMSKYDGVLTVETGAHVFLRSLDNYDMIRGYEYSWAWIDEISSTIKEAWDVVIGGLRDKNSDERQIRVTGTPDGTNWTWEEFKKKWSSDPLESAQYDIVFMSSRENPFLPPDFLDGMLSSYDSRKALQEIDGRILADQAALVYHEWRPDYHKKVVAPYDPNKPLILCWDFNSAKEAPLSMVICQKHEYSDGTPFVQVIDEFTMPGGNTPEVCSRIVAKYKDIHKSDVHVYGDTSGTRSTNGTTDYEQIRQRVGAFFKVINHVTRTNMKVKDRIGAVNGMLLNSKGQIRLFVNPECKELCLDFDKVQPGKFDLIDKSNPARTHTSDALGYFIAKEYPVVYKAPIAIKNMNISNINYR